MLKDFQWTTEEETRKSHLDCKIELGPDGIIVSNLQRPEEKVAYSSIEDLTADFEQMLHTQQTARSSE